MALNIDYVARETATNLVRNITLTLASMLTVAVSLALFGGSLLLRQGVQNASTEWKGNVEVIVFLVPHVSPEQRDEVNRKLAADKTVKKFRYVNNAEAYSEFKQIFKDEPDVQQSVSPNDLPTSFKVTPTRSDFPAIQDFTKVYSAVPGVYKVTSASDTIKTMQKLTGAATNGIFVVATLLLAAAVLLIFNTIRTAMFARRREIEVMKLVGATNWFIRIPFMLEGMIQALIGALSAAGMLYVLAWFFKTRVSDGKGVELLRQFVVSGGDVLSASIWVVLVGLLLGAIGSAVAVSRFLDV